MTEDFLHYLWKHQNFKLKGLQTTEGESLEVLLTGYHNHNSGPDFKEAKLRLGQRTWAGSVEIHVCSSDWFRHRHQFDEAYGNVILHVVYEHDRNVPDASGQNLPVLELRGRFDEYEYWRFEQLIQSRTLIPCAAQLRTVDSFISNKMLERAVSEKLEAKKYFILKLWEKNNRDWLNTSYQLLAYGLGLKINAEAMMQLVRAVPWRIVARELSDKQNLEALFLGTSGLLRPLDSYTTKLVKIYHHLNRKYEPDKLPKSIWKYSRLRPSSFPERRIVQLAHLIFHYPDLPRLMLEFKDLSKLRTHFASFEESIYWQTHYRLGKPVTGGKNLSLNLSGHGLDRLLINALLPLRYTYDSMRGETEIASVCLNWLDKIKPEQNRVVKEMIDIGFNIHTAAGSQGALHLNKTYCQAKKCLNCAIGIKILRS
jgi:hypothetical protein